MKEIGMLGAAKIATQMGRRTDKFQDDTQAELKMRRKKVITPTGVPIGMWDARINNYRGATDKMYNMVSTTKHRNRSE